ncbi:3'-5' exonuclease [Enterocloster clostridioformis]
MFIIDCCHGSIPISKAKLKAEIEEERRLFYVAVTRARESLYLLNYSQKPESKGKVTQVKPSMFLKEMNPEFAEGDLRHFKAGMSVNHKTLEAGIVVSKTLFFVNIHFENGNKIFPIKLTKKTVT